MRVALAGPLDVAASVGPLSAWGDDLLDRWDGECFVRTAGGVPYAGTSRGSVLTPEIEVDPPAAAPLVEAMFQQREAALAALAAADPAVAGLVAAHPGVRPVRSFEPFFSLVRSISAQQVNLGFAARLRRRLAETFGVRLEVGGREVRWLDPERIAAVDPAEIRALQFTTAKAVAIVGVARAIAEGALDPAALEHAEDDEVVARLTRLRGVGRWTAEWYLVRTLGRPAVAAGDLVVRKAVGGMYLGGSMPTEVEVRRLTAHWGEAAAIVQQLALRDVVLAAGG